MAKKHPSLDNIRFSNPKYGMVTNGISSLISENSHQRWKYPILIEALLKLFAPAMTRNEYLGFVVDLIREWSGCQGVGVRVLDREDNILYEACRGFSREFWEHHNWISLERDKCVCTRVVAGKPEIQDLPCLTALGSFYSNDTVSFIEGLSERQRLRFRGGCVNRGYLSVAIVPFRWEGKILGTIHLADEKAGMVPLEMVEQLELVTPVLGEALHRFELE
ncbi:MAG: GAF domain-containing protein, partial [Chloroflexota bacterium]